MIAGSRRAASQENWTSPTTRHTKMHLPASVCIKQASMHGPMPSLSCPALPLPYRCPNPFIITLPLRDWRLPMAGLEPAWARGPSHPIGGIGSMGLTHSRLTDGPCHAQALSSVAMIISITKTPGPSLPRAKRGGENSTPPPAMRISP